ncbi:MAG: TonB-dependent receptor plug domain-containing protein [Flavobacteriaceae bacterium]|nr:TonB-dependent receptor plug domain-containing protein [Flavobacteriaceae bacterium]
MRKIIAAFLILFLFGQYGIAQFDSINELEEVMLYGRFSDALQSGYTNVTFSDSILSTELSGLGHFLQKETNLYFKEYGLGMVSTISLRGSTAAQTAVFWNGIPVNSLLNGQTDFNSIGINGFSALEIKKGGGSVVLGSGAVGGAINLTNQIQFGRGIQLRVTGNAGSYETYVGAVQGVWSADNFYAKISATYGQSDNDYPYPDTDMKNENGQFKNVSYQYVLGKQINASNLISFYGANIKNDRNLSGTLTAPR